MIGKLVLGTTKNSSIPVVIKNTGPENYREYIIDANGKLSNGGAYINWEDVRDIDDNMLKGIYSNGTGATGEIDTLQNLTTISGRYACENLCYNNTNITGFDFGSLETVSGDYALHEAFRGCSGLTNIDISSLTTVDGQYSMQYCFYGCNHLTSIDLSSFEVLNGYYSMQNCFYNCSRITSIDLSSLRKLAARDGMSYAFSYCSSLTHIEFPSLTVMDAQGIFYNGFSGCTNLVSIDFSKLVTMNNTGCMYSGCPSCSGLTNFDISSLKYMQTQTFYSCFRSCTSLQELRFPALREDSFGTAHDHFYNMVQGITGCTLYFPKNLDPQTGSTKLSSESTYPYFGGTNTVLSFTLPSTFILTGANSTEYERNPKYDTQTALAWRVKDTGTLVDPIIDWTPFYTSSTSDPQVGDTLYSDSACTTAVTTISTIA